MSKPKTVLITGISSGFGKAVAEHLSARGFVVIGTSRKVLSTNLPYKVISLDVDSCTSVNESVTKLINAGSTIDVLINNAGTGIFGAVEDTSVDEAKAQFETNFFGTFRMVRAILPLMRNKGGGIIINISSLGGIIGLPFQAFYAASKFALEGFTESLRMEVKPFNIKVLNIHPADFNTTFTKHRRFTKVCSEPYRKQVKVVQKIVEHGEENGENPAVLALLIEKIINQKKQLNIRYLIGKKQQTIAVLLKRVLGANLFEPILRNSFKIK